jgi:glutamate dehydrogenase (NAD(P)+)
MPAALEGQITQANAARIRARIVAEAANGPVTAEADAILRAAGKLIVPDLYLNAGGVTVSYFEWIKNLGHMRFGRLGRRLLQLRAEAAVEVLETALKHELAPRVKKALAQEADELNLVRSGLLDTMREAYAEIRELWRSRDDIPDLRTAAYMVAIAKVSHYYREYMIA